MLGKQNDAFQYRGKTVVFSLWCFGFKPSFQCKGRKQPFVSRVPVTKKTRYGPTLSQLLEYINKQWRNLISPPVFKLYQYLPFLLINCGIKVALLKAQVSL